MPQGPRIERVGEEPANVSRLVDEGVPRVFVPPVAVLERSPHAIHRAAPVRVDQSTDELLGEFGDDPHRYASGKARKNYAGTSPLTRASGKKKMVMARFIRNDRLIDALMAQALSALGSSPGARAFYDAQRADGAEHNAALRKLANRLVGILHGCLKTRTLYDEATAWPHQEKTPQSDIAA